MNNKKVAKLNDLPPEFALEKYENVRHFELMDWLCNLQARLILEQPRPHARVKRDPVEICRKLLDEPLFGRYPAELDSVIDAIEIATTVKDFKACDLFWNAQEYLDGRFEEVMGRPTSVSHPSVPRPHHVGAREQRAAHSTGARSGSFSR